VVKREREAEGDVGTDAGEAPCLLCAWISVKIGRVVAAFRKRKPRPRSKTTPPERGKEAGENKRAVKARREAEKRT